MKIDISVIIPVHSAADRINDLFISLQNLELKNLKVEYIFIADRCSKDTIKKIAKWCCLNNRQTSYLIKADFGHSDQTRSAGIKKAKGRLLAFLDDDCRPVKKWLFSGVKHIQKHDAITGKISHSDILPDRLIALMDFGEFQQDKPTIVSSAPGCNLLVKAEKVSKFPSAPDFGYTGDRLLSAFLAKSGSIGYYPDFEVFHDHGDKFKDIWKREHRYGQVAMLSRQLDPSIPWSFVLKLGVATPFILTCGRLFIDLKRVWQQKKQRIFYKLVVSLLLFPCRIPYLAGAIYQYKKIHGIYE